MATTQGWLQDQIAKMRATAGTGNIYGNGLRTAAIPAGTTSSGGAGGPFTGPEGHGPGELAMGTKPKTAEDMAKEKASQPYVDPAEAFLKNATNPNALDPNRQPAQQPAQQPVQSPLRNAPAQPAEKPWWNPFSAGPRTPDNLQVASNDQLPGSNVGSSDFSERQIGGRVVSRGPTVSPGGHGAENAGVGIKSAFDKGSTGDMLMNTTSKKMSQIEGLAHGGPVDEDQPVMVGEQGPEIIVPKRPAVVIPNQYVGAKDTGIGKTATPGVDETTDTKSIMGPNPGQTNIAPEKQGGGSGTDADASFLDKAGHAAKSAWDLVNAPVPGFRPGESGEHAITGMAPAPGAAGRVLQGLRGATAKIGGMFKGKPSMAEAMGDTSTLSNMGANLFKTGKEIASRKNPYLTKVAVGAGGAGLAEMGAEATGALDKAVEWYDRGGPKKLMQSGVTAPEGTWTRKGQQAIADLAPNPPNSAGATQVAQQKPAETPQPADTAPQGMRGSIKMNGKNVPVAPSDYDEKQRQADLVSGKSQPYSNRDLALLEAGRREQGGGGENWLSQNKQGLLDLAEKGPMGSLAASHIIGGGVRLEQGQRQLEQRARQIEASNKLAMAQLGSTNYKWNVDQQNKRIDDGLGAEAETRAPVQTSGMLSPKAAEQHKADVTREAATMRSEFDFTTEKHHLDRNKPEVLQMIIRGSNIKKQVADHWNDFGDEVRHFFGDQGTSKDVLGYYPKSVKPSRIPGAGWEVTLHNGNTISTKSLSGKRFNWFSPNDPANLDLVGLTTKAIQRYIADHPNESVPDESWMKR